MTTTFFAWDYCSTGVSTSLASSICICTTIRWWTCITCCFTWKACSYTSWQGLTGVFHKSTPTTQFVQRVQLSSEETVQSTCFIKGKTSYGRRYHKFCSWRATISTILNNANVPFPIGLFWNQHSSEILKLSLGNCQSLLH